MEFSIIFFFWTLPLQENKLFDNSIRSSNGSRTCRYLITYKNMLRAVENLGIEIAFGIIFIGNGELSKENYVKYIERHRKIELFRNVHTDNRYL